MVENQKAKVNIYYMGKKYLVSEGLTIHEAMEEVGYKWLRGCGCRGGFCGACGTIYRLEGDFRIKVGLACQLAVKEGMKVVQLPYFPANKALYNLSELEIKENIIGMLYPEIYRCVQCNTCTKICPQDIKVMRYIASAIKGDIEALAKISFDCIMCGLCASRCPAEIVQHNVAILGRRLYGSKILPRAAQVQKRLAEIGKNKFSVEFKKLKKKNIKQLKELYQQQHLKRHNLGEFNELLREEE